MHIALITTDPKVWDWFVKVAKRLSASIEAYNSIEQLEGKQFDLLFWCHSDLDHTLYNRALAICPRFAWFEPRETARLPRLGAPRKEPIAPMLTYSDPEEIEIILRHWFSL